MGVYRKRSLLSIYPYKQTGLSRALFSTTERKYRLLAEVTFLICVMYDHVRPLCMSVLQLISFPYVRFLLHRQGRWRYPRFSFLLAWAWYLFFSTVPPWNEGRRYSQRQFTRAAVFAAPGKHCVTIAVFT